MFSIIAKNDDSYIIQYYETKYFVVLGDSSEEDTATIVDESKVQNIMARGGWVTPKEKDADVELRIHTLLN